MSQLQPGGSVPPDLPGYRFMRHIGSGGNAQVYLYEQDLPRRDVAVKVLNESALADAARRRFTAEANVTAGLAHRHIVQVFDAKVTGDGRPYIVMPYYPRPNLLVRARRAHLSVADVLRIGIQIGSAVETSHRRGVLHRDIKPQNILTDSYGEPALTDFGIATTKGGDGPEGLSVPWSPPEILYGAGAGDQRSDVYSLGATLWHVLAGRSPFEQPAGDNRPLGLMGRIRSDPVPPTGRADVPDSLERLLRQAMAKDPAARPQTAMDLIRGLQSVEQELRLPLTQPILPAGEPVDTSWGDTSIIPAVRIEKPGPARPEADDPTRARSPRRIDPWSPPPSAPGGSGGRVRQFPPEAPESATLARPRAAATQPVGTHADDAVAQGRGTSGRILALAGGGVLLAAVLAAAVLVLGHSHGSTQAPAMTAGGQPGIAQDALGVTPGKPTVTARSIGRQRVEFSWVYTRSAPSDSFVVQVNGGSWKPVTPRKPDLVLSVAQGQRVCIQVQVVSSGGGEGSPPSSVSCWPAS